MHIVRLSKREIVGSLSSIYFCDGDCVEVGGQGIPTCHTAATACGWQSGLVNLVFRYYRIIESLSPKIKYYIMGGADRSK